MASPIANRFALPRKLSRKLLIGIALCGLSSTALAGGMCASASGGPSLSASSSFSGYAVDTRWDRQYRKGKLAFAKRDTNGKKIKYCMMIDGEAKRITRQRLKAVHGKSVLEFAQSLVACDQPKTLALARVENKMKIPDILYYLSAHYGVNLVSASPDERIAKQETPAPNPSVAAGQ